MTLVLPNLKATVYLFFGPKGRAFSSKDKKAVKVYLEEVHHHLQCNRVITRVQDLIEDPHPNHDEAEALDREITRAILHAEKKIQKRRLDYWCIDIHKKILFCNFLFKLPDLPASTPI